jgi:hypothetical protein
MTPDRAAAVQNRFASAPLPTDSEFNTLRAALHNILRHCFQLIADRQLTAWEWQRFCDMSAGDDPEQAASWEWLLRPVVSKRVVAEISREVLGTRFEELVTAINPVERLRILFLQTSTDSSRHASTLMNTLVNTFARRVVERSGSGAGWSEEAFVTTFEEVVGYVKEDSDTFLCSSPLQQFAMDSDRLTIWPDLWVERLTWAERRKRLQDASVWGSVAGTFTPMSTAQERFALRFCVRLPRFRADDAVPMMIVRASKITERVVLALRVHHRGPVRSDGKWFDDLTAHFDASEVGSAYGMTTGFGDDYQLAVEHSTASDLREMLRLLEHPDDDTGLAVALRRFEFAYKRGSDEDRIVDYWIALEALYTERGERKGITAKLASRIPVISASAERRKILSMRVRELYDVRSDVVHGAEITREKLHTHVERSAELVREAIHSRLRDHWTPRELETRGDS